jgi:hypothetical protein
MKRLVSLFLVLFCAFFMFSACQKENPLFEHVSELRSDVFFGQSENYSIKASYGFKETPYNNDGDVKTRVYILHFILLDKEIEQATYTLTMQFNGFDYSTQFKLNPVTHVASTDLEINDFALKSFNVTVNCGSENETITLSSTLPENTITPQTALESIYKHQKSLVDSFYSSDGTFNAEIYLRVLVKDAKPYYYVGFGSGNNSLKAFLLDGLTGEVLAIRQIF